MAYGPRNLRIAFTGQHLTHFGGLFLVQRFFQRLGLRRQLSRAVHCPQRNTRYSTSELLLALLYPTLVGLGRIETTGILQQNGVFRYLTGLARYPNATTLRRFLARFAREGLPAFVKFHDGLRHRMLAGVHRVVFDLDTTVLTVYGRQQGARIGYNPKKRGRPSYLPLLCFEGGTRDLWEGSFHPGNAHPVPLAIELLTRALAKLPPSVREVRVRADAAFLDGDLIDFLERKRIRYAIVARLTPRLKARLGGLRFKRVVGDLAVAEFAYQPMEWKRPARFIAIRRPVPEEPTWQLSLFTLQGYTYQVLVTNLPLTPYRLWRFYNDRAEAELVIRELKEAYALGKIPTRDWPANVAYFHLVALAYNLLNWFKRMCLPEPLTRASLVTIRTKLLAIPAELVRPHGVPTLKLPASFRYRQLFNETLRRIHRLRLPPI